MRALILVLLLTACAAPTEPGVSLAATAPLSFAVKCTGNLGFCTLTSSVTDGTRYEWLVAHGSLSAIEEHAFETDPVLVHQFFTTDTYTITLTVTDADQTTESVTQQFTPKHSLFSTCCKGL